MHVTMGHSWQEPAYIDIQLTGEGVPLKEVPDEVLYAIGNAAGDVAQRFVTVGTVCGHTPTRDHYCGVMVCPWYAGRHQ